MSAEKDFVVTIDGRDLFGFVRGAIKSAIEDLCTDDRATDSWICREATRRSAAAMEMLNHWNTQFPKGSDCVVEPVQIFDGHGRSVEAMVSPSVARQIQDLRRERDYLMGRLFRAGAK